MAGHFGMTANDRRWHSLIELTGLLHDGKVRIEDLAKEVEIRRPDHATAYDLRFLKHGKRSPRTNTTTSAWIRAATRIRNNSPGPVDNVLGKTIKNGGQGLKARRNPNVPCRSKKGGASKKPKGKRPFMIQDHVMIEGYPKVGPAPPEAIKKHILGAGGRLESLVFLIEKHLYRTDVRRDESRLSMPCRQVWNRFLEPGEMETLVGKGGFVASLVQPSLEECRLKFSYWKSNMSYALHEGWNPVPLQNALAEHMVVRLWAFRKESSELCFVLQKMD